MKHENLLNKLLRVKFSLWKDNKAVIIIFVMAHELCGNASEKDQSEQQQLLFWDMTLWGGAGWGLVRVMKKIMSALGNV